MAAKYASGTSVNPARSREELDKMLRKYGATGFGYVDQDKAAALMFTINGRTYRYMASMPQLEDFRRNAAGYALSSVAQKRAWEQSVREQWRALVATIKGKLIAIDTGIETFEEIFQRYTVMPTGETLGEWAEPRLEEMYQTGQLPKMLPGGKG